MNFLNKNVYGMVFNGERRFQMIELQNIEKTFQQVQALFPLSLSVKKGEIHGIIGASGAGKSTLIRMINLLEKPDRGAVFVDGVELTALNNSDLRKARQNIGMIFQQFQLILNRTVAENVEMPLELLKINKKSRQERVRECLRFVGLEDKWNAYPSQLSGGQKQRVAIARALANAPSVLLCDEPTSSLDPTTTGEIMQVLQHINETLGVTIVIVTHEMDVVKSICNRVSILKNGKLVDQFSIQPTGIQNFEDQYIANLKNLSVEASEWKK